MAEMGGRMELIGSAILGQAQQEARELIDKANAIREKEISSFENEILDNMFNEVQSKSSGLRQSSTKTIAKGRLEAHHTLLLHRAEKTETALDNVRKKLTDYAQTSQYQDDVLKRAGGLKDSYDHTASVILVAEKDMPLGEEIKKVLGNGTVKADSSIKLGGFKLRNEKKHILIDETLDERLDEQKLWLFENCGLKVN